ncbi:hypothetical protein PILCRDRAFT_17551 [Piloderma croceum F 1598]|uniref:Uncharacterized protein n=1 Tax=Piloderma croceum (strain F 1598) TaxID=765440 RepID=A0A0C3B135_PILCF|nr:hypothetical protein PILCRDRAFT_17551 [Piloderma croceum F 1598]
MVPGYPNLARPPRCLWEYRREEEKKQEKFDWFTSSKDDIREEVASILKHVLYAIFLPIICRSHSIFFGLFASLVVEYSPIHYDHHLLAQEYYL